MKGTRTRSSSRCSHSASAGFCFASHRQSWHASNSWLRCIRHRSKKWVNTGLVELGHFLFGLEITPMKSLVNFSSNSIHEIDYLGEYYFKIFPMATYYIKAAGSCNSNIMCANPFEMAEHVSIAPLKFKFLRRIIVRSPLTSNVCKHFWQSLHIF